jgi:hypothetical protein
MSAETDSLVLGERAVKVKPQKTGLQYVMAFLRLAISFLAT